VAPGDTPDEGFQVRDRRGQAHDPAPARPAHLESSRSPLELSSTSEFRGAVSPGSADLPAEADLAALFVLLANSALLHLGEAPEAAAGAPPVDPPQARFSIDLLRLLKEKTEGNRTPAESRLLEGILYDLQMRFVRSLRRG